MTARFAWFFALIALGACGHPHSAASGDAGGGGGRDAVVGGLDAISDASRSSHDGGVGGRDAGAVDGKSGGHDAPSGVISGGPCQSGAAGAAAFRITWANAQGEAYVVYDVDGLPDHSRDMAGAYGFEIGFTAQFVDPFLAQGGVQLDDSDFIDLELTTAGVTTITTATLSLYGRSLDVSASGSFNWQTFVGTGLTPTDFVSNVPPYQWYSADMTTEIAPDDAMTLIRIKAGPSSGVLVVNQIELCLVAS